MTLDEAINYFKSNIESLKRILDKRPKLKGSDLDIEIQASDMAIKALEQEPQTFEWCTDCREYDQEKHCCHRWSKVIRDTVEEMKQPKTGQWILLDKCSNSGYYCSECHKKVVKEGWSDTIKKIKYCPNCGAKMQEVEDGNE